MIADVPTELTPRAAESGVAKTVSMHVVRVLIDMLARGGVSRDRLLQATGISEPQLAAADARLPFTETLRITETALELSGDPAFGLRWAEALSVDTFSPTTYLITHAATLGEGIDSLLMYSKLLSDQSHVSAEYDGDEVRLVCQPIREGSAALQRMGAELAVIAFIRIVRTFCPTFCPERVCFEYPAPSYADEYSRVFERAARFGQPYTGLAFDRALLSARAPYRDQTVHDALRALAERRLSAHERSPYYAARVRDLLVERGRIGGPAMIEVATKLGLSVHALRRRLTAEATTFAALEHEAFAALVKQHLLDRQHTIQEAAYELGFSGTAAFHRAFKRALGLTPQAYLQSQRK